MIIVEKRPDGNSDGEFHGDQLLVSERVAAARPGGAIRINDVIERIIARTTSRGQSRRPLECQRHLRRNAQDRVG